jgi:SAM-dependent methyltransferase
MNIYRRFAQVYAAGPYPGYSLTLIDALPGVFKHFKIHTPGHMLDVACGEGSFAVAMAEQGWAAAGLDQSPEQLALARKLAERAGVHVYFRQGDMREPFELSGFDLVTCWYDSLNYLLDENDLARTFNHTTSALKPGGWFLFDMNTIYGLAVGWQRQKAFVQQDSAHVFEIHRPSYDFERQIATLQITAFLPQGELWERFDEIHQERGYPLETIQACLQQAGFESIEAFGSIREFTPPGPDSQRVWFAARKV